MRARRREGRPEGSLWRTLWRSAQKPPLASLVGLDISSTLQGATAIIDATPPMDKPVEKDWEKKQREYEVKKARAKAFKLRLTCTICGEKAKLNCPCETTQYCSVACQKIDWRERGHRKACKKIRAERAAEAARAEAPTPPPSPPREVFYGPAPRSHADEVRARIAAEHEAARARREAEPEPKPIPGRRGSRCPLCFEDWDVNGIVQLRPCCFGHICATCAKKLSTEEPCPLCRTHVPSPAAELAMIRRHAENDVPQAIQHLGKLYRTGQLGLVKSAKKAAKIYKRAVELGNVQAMLSLAELYQHGEGEIKVDKKKARQLFQMAADRGLAKAQCNLANCFHREGQMEEAFRLYKMAAEQGLTSSQYNVGVCYEKVVGVERDLDEARRWYALAAAKGHERAIKSLAKLAPA